MASTMISGVTVRIDHLSFAYDRSPPVLLDLSLDVLPNSVVAICGPSGCGKTTLLRLISGTLAPQRGRISLLKDGIPYDGPIGVVTQQFTNFEWMTSRQNVIEGALAGGAGEALAARQADCLLDEFGLASFDASYIRMLSGGQQQRVAFARAVASAAGLMLLDEPFSALDPIMRLWLAKRVLADRSRIGTVVIVTHDINEAVRLVDDILILPSQGGQVSVVSVKDLGNPAERDPLAMAAKSRQAISFMTSHHVS